MMVVSVGGFGCELLLTKEDFGLEGKGGSFWFLEGQKGNSCGKKTEVAKEGFPF